MWAEILIFRGSHCIFTDFYITEFSIAQRRKILLKTLNGKKREKRKFPIVKSLSVDGAGSHSRRRSGSVSCSFTFLCCMSLSAEMEYSGSLSYSFFRCRDEVVRIEPSSPRLVSNIASTVRWMVGLLTLGLRRFYFGGGRRLSSFFVEVFRAVDVRVRVWWPSVDEISNSSMKLSMLRRLCERI